MLAGQVLSALRARGQATLEASAAHAAGSSPRLLYELEETVDPVNGGPGELPPLGPGLPPSIHASGVDCWRGLVERLGEPTDVDAVIHSSACQASTVSSRSSRRPLGVVVLTTRSRLALTRRAGPPMYDRRMLLFYGSWLVLLVMAWGMLDAAYHRDSIWREADQNKVAWVLVQFIPFVGTMAYYILVHRMLLEAENGVRRS
jgi:hypothetical protein